MMKNLLLSAAIGDIAGMPYEFGGRTKDYDAVNLLLPKTHTRMTPCVLSHVQMHCCTTLTWPCRLEFDAVQTSIVVSVACLLDG